MAINKNFVIKHGLEVSTDLILANADTNKVGVGTTAPEYTLHVNGGIGATDFYLSGIGTFVNELNVGLGGTVLTVLGIGNSIGIGTALPAFLLDVRSPVSTGQTALYVQGDVRITGDLNVDDITLDEASLTNLYVSGIGTIVNGVITNLTGTAGTITTFNSTNGTITNLTGTAGTITTFNSTNGTITNLTGTAGTITTFNSTNGTITNLTGTSGTITTFNSTNGIITNLTGTSGTITTLNSTSGTITNLTGTSGTITNLTGTAGTITTFNSTNGTIINLTGTSGTITTLNSTSGTITNLTGTSGTITTFNSTSGTITNLTGTAGTITNLNSTNGSIINLNVSGISTLGTVKISSGIITATSGVVTYFGDGSYLTGTASLPNLQTVLNTGNTSIIGFNITGVSTLTTLNSTSGTITNISGTNLNYSGIGTITNLKGVGINITGIATATDFDALSDENYKENVITVNDALNKVEQLRGVSFDWKENGRSSYGVIAQELQKVLPELVHGDNPKTVNYNGIIGVLIEAVKELKKEIVKLKSTK